MWQRQKCNDTIGQNRLNTRAARAARILRHFFDRVHKNKTFLVLEVLTAGASGSRLSVIFLSFLLFLRACAEIFSTLFVYICK